MNKYLYRKWKKFLSAFSKVENDNTIVVITISPRNNICNKEIVSYLTHFPTKTSPKKGEEISISDFTNSWNKLALTINTENKLGQQTGALDRQSAALLGGK